MKGRAEACATYVSLPDRLPVLPLCKDYRKVTECLLFTLLCGGCKQKVRKECCVQHPCQGGGAKNATLGESATRLEVGFPMPRFD